MTFDLAEELSKQLSWHWDFQLRPRLDGLSDEEYLWEPVPGSWNLHRRGQGRTDLQDGSGEFTVDYAYPPPEPAPMTTIAWQLAHLLVGIFGDRNARHFGAPPVDYQSYDYPGTAAAALIDLDARYQTWITGVRGLTDDELAAPCGEPGFEADPMIGLVLHIHREVIHHGAMISQLRDLWAHRSDPG
ncbi:DinB family protein [Microlunatus sp. Gsoil 973]|uniref:DinB family protein n=1 Tax=Microlunatus sp. Gsoil 973 TaxID=2672569 RepID=UPI0012B45B88|nr:DinB family protein [Microlunatus sp. Gsoil 973]QGN33356.1 DinB family protein [Microlunatus sp. Gsoil 973]